MIEKDCTTFLIFQAAKNIKTNGFLHKLRKMDYQVYFALGRGNAGRKRFEEKVIACSSDPYELGEVIGDLTRKRDIEVAFRKFYQLLNPPSSIMEKHFI
jgi:hypothetical protein